MNKKLKGFTLVEVLIVIIIVGILIAALLPRLVGSQARARDISRQAGVNQISNAVGLLMNDHGSLTTTGTDNIVCISALTSLAAGTADLSDYLASLPEDPQANHTNADTVLNGANADCDGSFAAAAADDGSAVFVFATMEGANGNYAQLSGSDVTGGVASMQALTAGTDVFGVIIQ
jgi:prepilin-type N-terminal cleavage/methylation domain-containing protein